MLDNSFGNGGKLTTAFAASSGTDVIHSLALQNIEGELRILAVGGEGDFKAARYTANGNLDTSFARDGKLVGVFNSNIGAAHGIVVLPDGKAVLAGHCGHQFSLAQLTVDGTLDPKFGNSGKVISSIDAAHWNEATAIARQTDDKLVVGGWVYTSGSNGDFALQRFTVAGVIDGGFGIGGVIITPMAQGKLNDMAHGLTLQSDPRVPTVRAIQVGEANSSNHNFAVVRYWL